MRFGQYNLYASCGPIAQWLERPAHNRLVAGSNPAGPTDSPIIGQWAPRFSLAFWSLVPLRVTRRGKMLEPNTKRLADWLAGFYLSKQAEGCLPKTLKEYQVDFAHFARWCNGRDATMLTSTDIKEFLAHLRTQPNGRDKCLSPRSVCNCWVALRNPYRHRRTPRRRLAVERASETPWPLAWSGQGTLPPDPQLGVLAAADPPRLLGPDGPRPASPAT